MFRNIKFPKVSCPKISRPKLSCPKISCPKIPASWISFFNSGNSNVNQIKNPPLQGVVPSAPPTVNPVAQPSDEEKGSLISNAPLLVTSLDDDTSSTTAVSSITATTSFSQQRAIFLSSCSPPPNIPLQPVNNKSPTVPKKGKGIKVLLLDDVRVNSSLVARVLKRQSYTCFITMTSTEALDTFTNNPTHIAILDFNLGHELRDGVDVAIDLRTINPHLYIIFISANNNDPKIIQFKRDYGCCTILGKPFDTSILQNTLTHPETLTCIENSKKLFTDTQHAASLPNQIRSPRL